MKKILLILLISILGLFYLDPTAVIAEGFKDMDVTMTISPPKQKIVLIPGEVYEGAIRVSNSDNSKVDLKYSVSVGSLSYVKDENGNTDFNNTDVDTITAYNQMMEWITLGKESGTVAPNTYDTVPFTITVPEDAPGGGQYATIIIQDDTYQGSEVGEGQVAIQSIVRFASSIFAEVAGETRSEGQILENSVPAISFSSPLIASSMVENNGNVHTDAEYILQVFPLFSDNEIYSNEDEPETSLIMPGSKRYHTQSWDGAPQVGIFRVKQTVKIFGETSVVEKIVIICPLWLLFIIVFIFVLIIMWFVSKARERNKKAKATSQR